MTKEPSAVGEAALEMPRKRKQKRYDYQLNLKVSSDLVPKLQDIADYELTKVSELLRGWIGERVKEYEGNRRYNKWLEVQRRRVGKRQEGEEEHKAVLQL